MFHHRSCRFAAVVVVVDYSAVVVAAVDAVAVDVVATAAVADSKYSNSRYPLSSGSVLECSGSVTCRCSVYTYSVDGFLHYKNIKQREKLSLKVVYKTVREAIRNDYTEFSVPKTLFSLSFLRLTDSGFCASFFIFSAEYLRK